MTGQELREHVHVVHAHPEPQFFVGPCATWPSRSSNVPAASSPSDLSPLHYRSPRLVANDRFLAVASARAHNNSLSRRAHAATAAGARKVSSTTVYFLKALG
jgi:hypothetical protein